LLHDYRGGKEAVVSSHSVALFAATSLAATARDTLTTLAYLRVSKDTQDTKNQRLALGEFARAERLEVDAFLELQASSRRCTTLRKVALFLARLGPGDTLVVSELSRLGRSVGEIIPLIETLGTHHIRVFALKEGLRLTGAHDLQTTVSVTLLGLCAEIERTLLALRTKEALAAAKAAGKALGRPRGARGKSQLAGKKGESKTLLAWRVSKASIATITGVDRATLYHFLRSRGLRPK
jgi:DNA invertase Pin-like site-specific DNA recombinase